MVWNPFKKAENLDEQVEYLSLIDTHPVEWSIEKIARDFVQNFYDGLDGNLDDLCVDIVEHKRDYLVHLSSPITYDYELLLDIGGTTKSKDDQNVGLFGEGTKIGSLILLRDYGISEIVFGSQNWELEYQLEKNPQRKNKKARSLTARLTPKTKALDGNYLQIRIPKKEHAQVFKTAADYFYHPNNPDFHEPTLDVPGLGGFKLLTSNPHSSNVITKGNFYYAKQRMHAFQESWHTLEYLNLWYHPKDTLTRDRDRGIANRPDIYHKILPQIIKAAETKQLIAVLNQMANFWEIPTSSERDPVDAYGVAGRVLELTIKELADRQVKLKFEEDKHYAMSQNVPLSLVLGMKKAGNKICWESLQEIGMTPANKSLGDHVEPVVLGSYMEGRQWSIEKIARDALQNFFDGSDQSFEGVDIDIQPLGREYKVRISGPALYDYRKIIHFGGTSKANCNDTAGAFGDATKIYPLFLLRNYGFSDVFFRSGDWQVEFRLEQAADNYDNPDVPMLYAFIKLNEDEVEGNYVEFTTDSRDLALEFVKAFDYFRHPDNPDFHEPTLETKVGGFKILHDRDHHKLKNAKLTRFLQKEGLQINHQQVQEQFGGDNPKGNLYIAGQRFSAKEKGWNNLEYAHLWVNPNNLVEIDRDRGVISKHDLNQILIPKVVNSASSQDLVKIVQEMEDFWEMPFASEIYNLVNSYDTAGRIIQLAVENLSGAGITLEFDEKYLAFNYGLPNPVTEAMQAAGYKICWNIMAKLGMTSMAEKYSKINEREALDPTVRTHKKLHVLYQAARLLEITPKEIRLYEEKGERPIIRGSYDPDFLWLERNNVDKPFFSALTTYLHEFCHKAGPHGTVEYDYALTEMLEQCLGKTTHRSKRFIGLEKTWQELDQQQEVTSHQIIPPGQSEFQTIEVGKEEPENELFPEISIFDELTTVSKRDPSTFNGIPIVAVGPERTFSHRPMLDDIVDEDELAEQWVRSPPSDEAVEKFAEEEPPQKSHFRSLLDRILYKSKD